MKRKIRYVITEKYRPAYTGQLERHQDWPTEDLISLFS